MNGTLIFGRGATALSTGLTREQLFMPSTEEV